MKNNKLLNIAIATPLALTSISPVLVSLTSCNQTTLLEQLEQATIKEFKALCNYPHSSDKFLYRVPNNSNVIALSNYLVQRCKELTMNPIYQDKFGNIWFDVDANDSSLVDVPTIALQAHMDMVFTYDPNQYKQGEEPDPTTTKIEIVEEVKDGKRIIHSKDYKTTIGADNGIGVSAILALLSFREVKHGKLRVIFTNCEENAMQGAMLMVDGYNDTQEGGKYSTPATAPAIMRNISYVLNFDGGLGDTLSVGCSGATGGYYFPKYDLITEVPSTSLKNHYAINIKGFIGGHSGGVRQKDDKSKGNAIKAAVETIQSLNADGTHFQLNSISTPGTTVYNRIPSECVVVFATDKEEAEIKQAFENVMTLHTSTPKKIWVDAADAKLEITSPDLVDAISIADSAKILTLLNTLEYGNDDTTEEGKTIKTSANIGPANLYLVDGYGVFTLETYSRSDSDKRVQEYAENNLKAAGTNFYCASTEFPSWSGETNRKLFNLTGKYLKEVMGYSEIKESAGHGGIEPAAWCYAMRHNSFNYNGNCVSIGINVANEHEVKETIDVESIQPFFKVATKILANATELK